MQENFLGKTKKMKILILILVLLLLTTACGVPDVVIEVSEPVPGIPIQVITMDSEEKLVRYLSNSTDRILFIYKDYYSSGSIDTIQIYLQEIR